MTYQRQMDNLVPLGIYSMGLPIHDCKKFQGGITKAVLLLCTTEAPCMHQCLPDIWLKQVSETVVSLGESWCGDQAKQEVVQEWFGSGFQVSSACWALIPPSNQHYGVCTILAKSRMGLAHDAGCSTGWMHSCISPSWG